MREIVERCTIYVTIATGSGLAESGFDFFFLISFLEIPIYPLTFDCRHAFVA